MMLRSVSEFAEPDDVDVEIRPLYGRSKLHYQRDLPEAGWSFITPLIPPAKRGENECMVDERAVVQELFHILIIVSSPLSGVCTLETERRG